MNDGANNDAGGPANWWVGRFNKIIIVGSQVILSLQKKRESKRTKEKENCHVSCQFLTFPIRSVQIQENSLPNFSLASEPIKLPRKADR